METKIEPTRNELEVFKQISEAMEDYIPIISSEYILIMPWPSNMDRRVLTVNSSILRFSSTLFYLKLIFPKKKN